MEKGRPSLQEHLAKKIGTVFESLRNKGQTRSVLESLGIRVHLCEGKWFLE